MGVSPGGVHDEDSRVVANGLGESLGSLLLDDVTPSSEAGLGGVERLGLVLGVDEGGDGDVLEESGLSNLSLDRRSVDDEVSKVGEDLLSSVLTRDEVEEGGGVVDELRGECQSTLLDECSNRSTHSGPRLSSDKRVVRENTEKEGDVGLDSSDPKLDEGTEHLATSDLECRSVSGALDQKRVVVRL